MPVASSIDNFSNPVDCSVEALGVEQFGGTAADCAGDPGCFTGAAGGRDDPARFAMARPIHGDELRRIEFTHQVDHRGAAKFVAR